MEFKDVILLLHPIIAVVVVFPLIGIVVNRALQTRQRRLQTAAGEKSKVPPSAGQEHVQLGRWLTGSVELLIFIAQGITGTQALLEVPLAWQEPYIQKLYEQQCDKQPCTLQVEPMLQKPQ